MHRIMIFGRPGSGKSTFALQLHKKTNLPLYHLDRYFYIENWVERDYQEFLALQQDLVNQEHWIIDGNNTRSLEMRYQRAQVCLYFNYPRHRCYWRIFKRRLFDKNHEIQDRAAGCSETVNLKLLKYMWTFEERVAEPIKMLRSKYPHVKFIEVNNDHDLRKIEE